MSLNGWHADRHLVGSRRGRCLGLLPPTPEAFEGPYDLLPRDPLVTVNVYIGVDNPLSYTAWHFRNGAAVEVPW